MRNRQWMGRELAGGAVYGLFFSLGMLYLVLMTTGYIRPLLGGFVMSFGLWVSDGITGPTRVNEHKRGFWVRHARIIPGGVGAAIVIYSAFHLRRTYWSDVTPTSIPWTNFLWALAGVLSFIVLSEVCRPKFLAWRKRKKDKMERESLIKRAAERSRAR